MMLLQLLKSSLQALPAENLNFLYYQRENSATTTAVKCKKLFFRKYNGVYNHISEAANKRYMFHQRLLLLVGLSWVGPGHKSKITRRTDTWKFIDLNLYPTNENGSQEYYFMKCETQLLLYLQKRHLNHKFDLYKSLYKSEVLVLVTQPDVNFSLGSPISPSLKTLLKQFGNGKIYRQSSGYEMGRRNLCVP